MSPSIADMAGHCSPYNVGRVDGWYSRDAVHMLGWWRAMWPGELFEMVQPILGQSLIGRDVPKLRQSNSALWASSRPDFAAADKYDREAA